MFLFFLQGCSELNSSPNAVLFPKIPEEQLDVIEQVQNQLPMNAHIVQVNTDETYDKYYFYDIDKDGIEELIVFYTTDDTIVHGSIFKQEDKNYILHQNFSTNYSDLFEISFHDLDSDGKNEMLIGLLGSLKNLKNKTLLIYKMDENEKFYQIETLNYIKYQFVTTTEEEALFYIKKDSNNNIIVSLTALQNNTLSPLSTIEIDIANYTIRNIQESEISKKYPGMSLEILLPDGILTHFLFYIKDSEIHKVNGADYFKDQMLSTSHDYDGDGNLEIAPIPLDVYNAYVTSTNSLFTFLLPYYRWTEENGYEHVYTSYINPIDDYVIQFLNTYKNNLAYMEENNEIHFYEKNTNTPLFTILKIEKRQKNRYKNYVVLGEKNDFYYITSNTNKLYLKDINFIQKGK